MASSAPEPPDERPAAREKHGEIRHAAQYGQAWKRPIDCSGEYEGDQHRDQRDEQRRIHIRESKLLPDVPSDAHAKTEHDKNAERRHPERVTGGKHATILLKRRQ